MMNRKISSEAWTENSPLKVFASTKCDPGCGELGAHQHRDQAADSRKKNELTVYWIPITLWSVLMRK